MTRFTTAAVLCVTMVAFSEAFLGPQFYPSRPGAAATRQSASNVVALQMNLFDRFSRVAKSNLNNILKNLEDPEKIMSQALEDMQVSLLSVGG